MLSDNYTCNGLINYKDILIWNILKISFGAASKEIFWEATWVMKKWSHRLSQRDAIPGSSNIRAVFHKNDTRFFRFHLWQSRRRRRCGLPGKRSSSSRLGASSLQTEIDIWLAVSLTRYPHEHQSHRCSNAPDTPTFYLSTIQPRPSLSWKPPKHRAVHLWRDF